VAAAAGLGVHLNMAAGSLGTRIGRKVAAVLVTGAGTRSRWYCHQRHRCRHGCRPDVDHLRQPDRPSSNSLDPAYRQNCRFMFADAALAVIRKIKTRRATPCGCRCRCRAGPTINGQPYFIDQGMAVPGARPPSRSFGDFRRAYVVRQVLDMNMVRFGERYMDSCRSASWASPPGRDRAGLQRGCRVPAPQLIDSRLTYEHPRCSPRGCSWFPPEKELSWLFRKSAAKAAPGAQGSSSMRTPRARLSCQ